MDFRIQPEGKERLTRTGTLLVFNYESQRREPERPESRFSKSEFMAAGRLRPTFCPSFLSSKQFCMLNIGCWILSVWSTLNLVASLKIILDTLLYGQHTPALFLILTESDVDALSNESLATIDSIALFANGLNVAFCILAIGLVWAALSQLKTWAFFLLFAGFLAAWLAGVAADFAVGNAAPWVNIISLALILFGLSASAIGLFGNRSGSAKTRTEPWST